MIAIEPRRPAPRHVPARPSPLLRRLGRVVRRRVRVDLRRLGVGLLTTSDGPQTVRLRMGFEAGVVAWEADRPVELVVLHTGCGVRWAGVGGLDGELRLPVGLGDDAWLAFCWDEAPDGPLPA